MSSMKFARKPLYAAIVLAVIGIAYLLFGSSLPLGDMSSALTVMAGGGAILLVLVSFYIGSREADDDEDEETYADADAAGEVTSFSLLASAGHGDSSPATGDSDGYDIDGDAPTYGFVADIVEAPAKMTREQKKEEKRIEREKKKADKEAAKFEKNAQKEAEKAAKAAAKNGGVVPVDEGDDWVDAIKTPYSPDDELFSETGVPMGYTPASEHPDYTAVGTATDLPMYDMEEEVVAVELADTDELDEAEAIEEEVDAIVAEETFEAYDSAAAPAWATAAYSDPNFAVPFSAPEAEESETVEEVIVGESDEETDDAVVYESYEETETESGVVAEDIVYTETDDEAVLVDEVVTVEVLEDEIIVTDETVTMDSVYGEVVLTDDVVVDEYTAEGVVHTEIVETVDITEDDVEITEDIIVEEFVETADPEDDSEDDDDLVVEMVVIDGLTDEEEAVDTADELIVSEVTVESEEDNGYATKFDVAEIVTTENIGDSSEYDIVEEGDLAKETALAAIENYLTYEQTGELTTEEEQVEEKFIQLATEMEQLIGSARNEVRSIRERSNEERAKRDAEAQRLNSALDAARSEVDRMAEELAFNSANQREALNSQSLLLQAEVVASRARLEREQAKSRLRQVRLSILSHDPVDEVTLAIIEKALSDFDGEDAGELDAI